MQKRLEILQKAAEEVRVGALSPESRISAGQAAHKLAGVLGMFGRGEGTEIVRAIEDLIEKEDGLATGLSSLVARLEGVIDGRESLSLGESGAMATRARARVLLIENDPALREALQRSSGSESVKWFCFPALEPARAWLENHFPDLLVIGVESGPGWESSLALIDELAGRVPSIPSLVLTGAEEWEARAAIVRAGGRKILSRPVVVERVTEVVDRLLRLRLRETVKVLAIDDDPVILDALPTLLAPWGIRVTGLENPLDFRSALVTASPDFLLLDVEMPGLSGIDLCQAVRADPRWQDLPILFLTVSRDPDTISRMFAAGGDDYLTKPIVGPELLTRLTYRWERSHLPLILSTRESITGLLNQPTSERELEGALREAKESGRPLSFVTIAIDDLDRVHWQHGHGTGNRILQFLGNLLKSRFLAGEVVGYWGNGEFAIGLPECSKTEAGDRVEDLLRSFRQHIFSSPDGDRFQVNPRRGIAEYPVDGLNLRSLYRVTVRGRSGGSVYRDEGLS